MIVIILIVVARQSSLWERKRAGRGQAFIPFDVQRFCVWRAMLSTSSGSAACKGACRFLAIAPQFLRDILVVVLGRVHPG